MRSGPQATCDKTARQESRRSYLTSNVGTHKGNEKAVELADLAVATLQPLPHDDGINHMSYIVELISGGVAILVCA